MKIIGVNPLEEFRVRLVLDDSSTLDIDLWQFISWGSIYEPLRDDTEFFRQVTVDSVAHTLTWPNGADIAPEALLAAATV